MPKQVIGIIAIIIVIAGGSVLALSSNKSEQPKNNAPQSTVTSQEAETPPSTSQTETAAPNASKTYTAAEVAKHTSKSDCWTIISGEVYNLTSFIGNHPGGSKILQVCGVDGTKLFSNQPSHGAEADSQLAKLKIGTLSN